MDEKAVAGGRGIIRKFEVNRLEEEVWALAYEEIWPVARRVLRVGEEQLPDKVRSTAIVSQDMARSA
jgi:hypothetical protein